MREGEAQIDRPEPEDLPQGAAGCNVQPAIPVSSSRAWDVTGAGKGSFGRFFQSAALLLRLVSRFALTRFFFAPRESAPGAAPCSLDPQASRLPPRLPHHFPPPGLTPPPPSSQIKSFPTPP